MTGRMFPPSWNNCLAESSSRSQFSLDHADTCTSDHGRRYLEGVIHPCKIDCGKNGRGDTNKSKTRSEGIIRKKSKPERTCSSKPWTRFVRILLAFRRSSPARSTSNNVNNAIQTQLAHARIRSSGISKCHISSPTARFRLVRPPARDKVARFPDVRFLLLLSMVRSLGRPT